MPEQPSEGKQPSPSSPKMSGNPIINFILNSGLYNMSVGGIAMIAALAWATVVWSPIVPVVFGVGLVLLGIGFLLFLLGEFLRITDETPVNPSQCLNAFDDGEEEDGDGENQARVSDVGILSDAGGLNIQSDVSELVRGGRGEQSGRVVWPHSEERNHGRELARDGEVERVIPDRPEDSGVQRRNEVDGACAFGGALTIASIATDVGNAPIRDTISAVLCWERKLMLEKYIYNFASG